MKYEFKIRFGDTDAYGIVHHRNFYHYFEEARFYFANVVFGFDVTSKIKFPLTESHCVYKIPLKFTLDTHMIDINCRSISNSKLEFEYRIMDMECKRVYAYGKTVHVYVDENDKLRLEFPKWLESKIETYMKEVEG